VNEEVKEVTPCEVMLADRPSGRRGRRSNSRPFGERVHQRSSGSSMPRPRLRFTSSVRASNRVEVLGRARSPKGRLDIFASRPIEQLVARRAPPDVAAFYQQCKPLVDYGLHVWLGKRKLRLPC
jgi:hypothetical protein